jgi:hypothetical protein
VLTVLIPVLPLTSLSHAGEAPEPVGFSGRILQALLDLDPFVGSDQVAHDNCVAGRRVESLVSSSLAVIDVFADDFPVFPCEGFKTKYFIGMP